MAQPSPYSPKPQFGDKPRCKGDVYDLTKLKAQVLERAIHGCCVGAEMASGDGSDEDHAIMMQRIRQLAQEMRRRIELYEGQPPISKNRKRAGYKNGPRYVSEE